METMHKNRKKKAFTSGCRIIIGKMQTDKQFGLPKTRIKGRDSRSFIFSNQISCCSYKEVSDWRIIKCRIL